MEAKADPEVDPEIKALYELHKVRRTKAGKPPLGFELWHEFYLNAVVGGRKSAARSSKPGRNQTNKTKTK